MDPELTERLKAAMKYELSRRSPPEGFPAFPDVPAGRYTSDAFFELEQKHLFSKVWQYAGRAEDLREPGSYVTCDWLRAPILLLRGDDGELRAFYNSCRHRGAPVVREKRGCEKILRCQYHAWCYDSRGGLVSVPDARDYVDLDKSTRGLVQLRCEVWDGWVFINEDPDARPLLECLGPIVDEMKEVQGETLRTLHVRTVMVPCNWKVAVEAFLEINHFKYIHHQDGFVHWDARGATSSLFEGGSSRMVVPLTQEAAERCRMPDPFTWHKNVRPGMTDIDTVSDIVRNASVSYLFFPNTMPLMAAHGMPFLFFWPVDARTTRFDIVHYIPDWGDGDPPEEWKVQLEAFRINIDQDIENMEPMHRSLESPGLTGVPLSYQERRLYFLHEEIDRQIGPERIPEELRVPPMLDDYIER